MNPVARLASTLSAGVLLVVATLGITPAQALAGDGHGDLAVEVVDHLGQPMRSRVYPVNATGAAAGGSSATSHLFQDLPAGRYGLSYLAPWGGMGCVGVLRCESLWDSTGQQLQVPGVVDVTDTETPSRYILRTPPPAVVAGASTVGSTLTVGLSAEMEFLTSFYGDATRLEVQWLRDGRAVPGAGGTTYTTTGPDVGRRIDARLAYAPAMTENFTEMGLDAAPLTVTGPVVAQAPTRISTKLFRKAVAAGQVARVGLTVTTGSLPAPGRVRVVVGKRVLTRTLRNGAVRIDLPRLRPGRYVVTARYLGTTEYAASQATPKKLRVVTR
jgi:hypothetical protein